MLDLRIKLVNEELIAMTERVAPSNSSLLNYLAALAKLYNHHENFSEEITRSLFSSWFLLNQSVKMSSYYATSKALKAMNML